jgi:pyruvate kinase
MLKRTKIIATLGPATDDDEVLAGCLQAGVNVVRLNFSHGDAAVQRQRIDQVRRVAQRCQVMVGILADLQGPKIRIGRFVDGRVELKQGDGFVLDAELSIDQGTVHRVGLDYQQLPRDVRAGDTLILDDGHIVLDVVRVDGSQIHTKVQLGGVLSNHKGVNRAGGGLSAAALSEKDINDLQHIASMDVDYVALSFVRDATEVHDLRQRLEKLGVNASIIAKIERAEALQHLDAIVEASDGVMVARGDLAIEIGDATVPAVQKQLITKARSMNRPVIVATQMMESMITQPTPTRAEVSDVANAVLDATDAVMLSAETAVGAHPVACVAAMARVCQVAEQESSTQVSSHRLESQFNRTDEAISMAAMYVANHLAVSAVIALTESGMTPLMMSRIRSGIPIYALSQSARTLGKMTLYRDVYPVHFDVSAHHVSELHRASVAAMQRLGVVQEGDQVLLTRGDHLGVHGGTNTLKILPVTALEEHADV